ncbi:hypothetical protein D9615_008983 [Tricholomella constricta]|uniref:CBM1 domain-containing protein n=1 Tax=Tricholomella constricta TaxID=117010 RepID=A0A8H5H134_9AGAR|nr:hypothetical protein D9615_008983 [Tricholomella constricta]
MLTLSALPFVAFATIISSALAQGAAWSQCGGIGWTGATTCVSGNTCTYVNDWYSQCIPGTSTPPTTTTASTVPPPTSTAKANYWFSFGDSYTQTGFSPTGTLPAVGNPLGNPPYPGWTATGGENWVDYVTTQHNRSLVFTYNYAYGGATIDANLVTPYTPTVLSLTDQVNQFLSGAGTKPASTPWTSANALFSIWIGINDIGNSFYLSGDRAAFSDTLLNAEFALVQKLVLVRNFSEMSIIMLIIIITYSNAGARNFLFVNVPPIERSPLMLAQPASSQAAEKTVITGFNSKLAAKVSAFKAANSGVSTWIWDSNASFTTILNSPTTYGFKDATSYGSASNQFWGNDYHPSSYAHKYFGQQVGSLLGSTVW